MLSVPSVPSVPSVGSVGKFSNNKIGGVVSVLLLCLMTAKYVLQGTGRFVGIILTSNSCFTAGVVLEGAEPARWRLPQNLNTGTGHTRGRTRNGRHTRHRTQRTDTQTDSGDAHLRKPTPTETHTTDRDAPNRNTPRDRTPKGPRMRGHGPRFEPSPNLWG